MVDVPEREREPRRAQTRGAALATLLCLLAFLAFSAGAMALYPGGTFRDRSTVGQSFFGNFFCDLTQPVSLSGVANPVGSRLAQCGMLFFGGALWGLFWVLPQFFAPQSSIRPWVARLSTACVLIFLAVPLTPSERFGAWHARLALIAGSLGITAAVLAVWALLTFERRARGLALLGSLALAGAAFASAVFIAHLGEPAPPLVVPAAQKVAALLLCLWIAAVALSALLDENPRRA